MPKGKTVRLRIFCICGQKMKVSRSMYGHPGKCVACRQKIRIPLANEIPDGTKEIHLKDHPEFLRKIATPEEEAVKSESAVAVEEEEVVDLGREDLPKQPTVALDVLEPLRILCSLDTKVQRHLKALAGFEQRGEKATDKQEAELSGYRARVRRARAELDELLRQRLMDTAVDLTTVQERLADLALSVRVGEIDYRDSRDKAARLRHRRDFLEERQQNLRGWLAVRDLADAGGFEDVSFDAIPKRPEVRLSREMDGHGSLVEQHLACLREALERREATERKLRAAENLRPREGESSSFTEERRAECTAAARRAKAAVAFYMGRLQQLRDDYAADIRAIDSQLDLARGRLQVGEINRAQYDDLEKALVKAKGDLASASDMINRALTAPSSADVPEPRGTFLKRLGPYRALRNLPADSYLAWGAAIALFVSLFLSALPGLSPAKAFVNAESLGTRFAVLPLPLLGILGLQAAVLLPNARNRGLAYTVLWLAGCAAVVAFLRGVLAGSGVTALVQPAVLLWFAALVAVLVAAGMALRAFRDLRFLPWGVALVALLLSGVVLALADRPAPAAAAPRPVSVTAEVPVARPAAAVPAPAAPPENTVPEPATSAVVAPTDEAAPAAATPVARTVDVEWRGKVAAPGREPMFSMTVYVPDQAPDESMMSIGDTIFGKWKLAEYNPVIQSVTLSDGERVIVLRSGQTVSIETLR